MPDNVGIPFAVCDLSFATFVRLPLPLCHRLPVLAAVRQRIVAGVVSHDHGCDGLARRVDSRPVDRASQKSPKIAATRNHPPAVPAVPQLA